ncbi:hypothetical protein [Sinorhizobium meliloti]|uniref:hypothetical protein n=1 Tax=Rhizobium meliloti TaxID=382 RepID=UPI000FE014D0|nr:hypothetical protein [Sinorhizobium meliloti]RVL94714.1 hypothetical protein CN136_21605 [Sinorhizobium meliloti]
MHSPDFPRIKKDDLVADYPGVFDSARYVDVGIGWLGIVRAFVNEALSHDPSLVVHELKEKWGTLRISADTDVLAARLAKGKAEAKSGMTCEVCGEEGWLRRPPPGRMAWWRTLCSEHASPDQAQWGQQTRWTAGQMQYQGQWYEYDRASDSMLPILTPERFR